MRLFCLLCFVFVSYLCVLCLSCCFLCEISFLAASIPFLFRVCLLALLSVAPLLSILCLALLCLPCLLAHAIPLSLPSLTWCCLCALTVVFFPFQASGSAGSSRLLCSACCICSSFSVSQVGPRLVGILASCLVLAWRLLLCWLGGSMPGSYPSLLLGMTASALPSSREVFCSDWQPQTPSGLATLQVHVWWRQQHAQ